MNKLLLITIFIAYQAGYITFNKITWPWAILFAIVSILDFMETKNA